MLLPVPLWSAPSTIVHENVDLLVFLEELKEIGIVVRVVLVVTVAGVTG